MKKGLLIILLVFTQQLLAQKASSALAKSYSKTELQQLEQGDQELLNALNYAVDHACYTIVIPEGKELDQFPSIVLKSKNNIRFTDYQLQIKDRTQYFKIEGSNDLLVIKSFNILKLEIQNKK